MKERFCNEDCIYLSCSECAQYYYRKANKENIPHVCNKYNKRLYHWEYHPRICKCNECLNEDGGTVI